MDASESTIKPSNTVSTTRRIRQNYLLIWVDGDIDEKDNDYQNKLVELRKIIRGIKTCRTSEKCIEYLNEMNEDKAFVITSAGLGQRLVQEIIGITKLDTIYILGGNRAQVEEWASAWPKIEGAYNSIQPIFQSLNKIIRGCDQELISMSFISKEMIEAATFDKNNNDQLPPTYMYTLLFKEIVLENDDDFSTDMKKFVNYCRSHGINEVELKEFQENYHRKTPIWWYTTETFVYGILNQALRQMQMEPMVKISFYIRHLHKQLQQLHEEQIDTFQDNFIVYRGQGLSKEDFQRLLGTSSGLLSFNNFLSTSMDKHVSMGFVERTLHKRKDVVGILFIMTIDSKKVSPFSTPFALIDDHSAIPGEHEILFSMHPVFRVGEIKQNELNNRLWEVQLTLTDDNDAQLAGLTKSMKAEIQGPGWSRMGKLLLKVGDFDQAKELYNELFTDATSFFEQAHVYHMLGMTAVHQGNFNESIKFFEKTLAINQIIMPNDHTHKAPIYSNIACAYDSMGNYTKALDYYTKSLEITKDILPENDPSLTRTYNSIGLVYCNMGDYTKALEYYNKALKIRLEVLPDNHEDVAISYASIGIAYKNICNYTKALEYCTKNFEISTRILTENHPHLASSYFNLGTVYNDMKNYTKALEYYEKALKIRSKALHENHPDLANSYYNLGLLYKNMSNWEKALEFYMKNLEVRKKTVYENHSYLAIAYKSVGSVYQQMSNYKKALEYYKKTLKIRQKALSENDPDLVDIYACLASVYNSMADYTKALEYSEKYSKILERIRPENDSDLADSYHVIGVVYIGMNNYTKALEYYEKALSIRRKILHYSDPLLNKTVKDIISLKKQI